MIVAFCGALFSAWMGLRWAPSWIAAALFVLSGAILGFIAVRPAIEIYGTHLRIGRAAIPWQEIRGVDQTGWSAPLAVFLTLRGDHRFLLFYPGDREAASALLWHLQRFSHRAHLDGIPYRQFWGEEVAGAPFTEETGEAARPEKAVATSPIRYPLLRPEDEEEVERMFQRLKSVGNLESKNSNADQQ